MDTFDSLQYLIDCIVMNISGWNKKISVGRMEILLKSVVQAIPTYTISVFKSSKKCKGIIEQWHNCLWGDEDNQRRMYLIAWWKICVPKNQ